MKRKLNRARIYTAVALLATGITRLKCLLREPNTEMVTVITYSICTGCVIYTLIKALHEEWTERKEGQP